MFMDENLHSRLSQSDLLNQAWLVVKQKGAAGGCDKVSISDFEKNFYEQIESLLTEIQQKTYCPRPYKQVAIDKNKGGKRILGLPSVRDKVLQMAVKLLIEPILEKIFLPSSYGYRPQKGPLKAVSRARHMIMNEKRDWVTICDIDKYFDTIPHNALMEVFSKYISDPYINTLVELWLKMGNIKNDYVWYDRYTGTPQGGVISPLLANLYLHSLDEMMKSKGYYGYIRYADDFIVLSHKEGEAFRALNDLRAYLTGNLQLTLNQGAHVKKVSEGFEFLGIYFTQNDTGISDEKFNRLKNNMAQAIKFTDGTPGYKLTEVLNGIARYYALIVGQEKLEMLDWALLRLFKEKCVAAVKQKGLVDKHKLTTYLMNMPLFSDSMRQRRKMLIDEIIASTKNIAQVKLRE